MKYSVENKLDMFEFHDTEFSFIYYDKSQLVLSAKHLNIHKDAPQNSHNYDMEIDFAKFVFEGFEVVSFEPMRVYKIDDDGNWSTNEPQMIYSGAEAEKNFFDKIKNGITINDFDISKKGNKTYIELSTCAQSCFFATLAFDEVFVEWDEYCKKAWYELHKQYIHKGYLITSKGEEETKIHIVYHEEDVYFQGKLEKAPTVSVGVNYDGEQIWGRGKDWLWMDAFADVQRQLPDGVLLKCCMTCRHGNLCPYGNEPGILYCTKDVCITSKNDMCNLFDSEADKIDERIRNVADSCSEYVPQSKEHYTYSDYVYFLDESNI